MPTSWEETEELFVACAEADLRAEGTVRPVLVAFAGATLRFVAWVRWFPKGAYAQPLTELFALAAPLDCDRLAFATSARAWSLEDPIPPVTEDADLRQRVLLVHAVDGATIPARRWSILRAFELGADGPVWGQRHELGCGTGWIPEAMAAVVAGRQRLSAPVAEIAKQATRVVRLGHELSLAPDLALLLFGGRGARSG